MGKVQEKQAVKKKQIIETVLRMMEDTPFEELRMEDICRACGLSVGNFYHYFRQKSDLLVGCFNLIDEYMIENVFPQLTCDDERKNLEVFFHGWATQVQDHGVERAKLLNTIAPVDVGQDQQTRPIIKQLRAIVSRGQEKGQLPADFTADEITRLLLIAARGVISDWGRRGGTYPLVPLMDEYIRLFFSLGKRN